MSKLVVLLALILIASGVIVLGAPYYIASQGQGMAVGQAQSWVLQLRHVAEQVNAPLSIVFGLVSLFYSRRTYLIRREEVRRYGH
ncbi:MAG: hypothetical protein AB7K67_19025 [Hyphomicrobiaceae bacterium]